MLTGDVLRFLIVYIVLLYGFASALFVLVYEGESDEDPGLQTSPTQVLCMYLYACMLVGRYVYTNMC